MRERFFIGNPAFTFASLMRIVLAKTFSETGQPTASNSLLENVFQQLAEHRPDHEWQVLQPVEPSRGLSLFRGQRAVNAILQATPNLVFFPLVNSYSFTNKIPSAILIADNQDLAAVMSIRKKCSNVRALITPSTILANQLKEASLLSAGRIHVVPLFRGIAALDIEGQTAVREQLTAGRDFFLFTGPIARNNNWERILQAFSQFKKWQQSGFQLVLTGNVEAGFKNEFSLQLAAYKYRTDVILASELNTSEKDQLAAAAFLTIAPYKSFENRMHITDAFQCGVPVITEKNELAIEITGDAAIHVDLNDAVQLSQQMIALYKNETLYHAFIQRGKDIALQFNYRAMLDQLSRILLSAAEG